jgi:hypothetical protein
MLHDEHGTLDDANAECPMLQLRDMLCMDKKRLKVVTAQKTNFTGIHHTLLVFKDDVLQTPKFH